MVDRGAKARRGATENETKSSERERSIGRNGCREISKEECMKLKWKEEGEEGSQGENVTILSKDIFICMLYIYK